MRSICKQKGKKKSNPVAQLVLNWLVLYLMNKNKSFTCPSRALFVSVHFFAVLGKSATRNDYFSSFIDNANTQA